MLLPTHKPYLYKYPPPCSIFSPCSSPSLSLIFYSHCFLLNHNHHKRKMASFFDRSAAIVAAVVMVMIAVLSASVSAQDFGMAPAPSPFMESAGFSLQISAALICSSLIFSMLAVFNHWVAFHAAFFSRSGFLARPLCIYICLGYYYHLYINIYIWFYYGYICLGLVLHSWIELRVERGIYYYYYYYVIHLFI